MASSGPSTPHGPVRHLVRLPLGVVDVTLERRGLALEQRGGFTARWATAAEAGAGEVLAPEAYRRIVKDHLREIYLAREGREPGPIALNLASHQLLDDVEGWSRLNARNP